MELTVTNRSQAYPEAQWFVSFGTDRKRCWNKDFVCGFEGADHTALYNSSLEADS